MEILDRIHIPLKSPSHDGLFTGHAPNYIKVYAKGAELHNQIRSVRITQVYQDGVLGALETEI